jgi:hypothetical protein
VILEQAALWLLRLMGALWVIGAVFLMRQLWFNAQLGPMITALEKAAEELGARLEEAKIDVDNGRERWMAFGTVLTLACGVAMVVGHRLVVPLLCALILQQMAYFARQHRRGQGTSDALAALGERPSQQTVNAFYTSLFVAALAALLYARGMLL